jgi:hypothetical protein
MRVYGLTALDMLILRDPGFLVCITAKSP